MAFHGPPQTGHAMGHGMLPPPTGMYHPQHASFAPPPMMMGMHPVGQHMPPGMVAGVPPSKSRVEDFIVTVCFNWNTPLQ